MYSVLLKFNTQNQRVSTENSATCMCRIFQITPNKFWLFWYTNIMYHSLSGTLTSSSLLCVYTWVVILSILITVKSSLASSLCRDRNLGALSLCDPIWSHVACLGRPSDGSSRRDTPVILNCLTTHLSLRQAPTHQVPRAPDILSWLSDRRAGIVTLAQHHSVKYLCPCELLWAGHFISNTIEPSWSCIISTHTSKKQKQVWFLLWIERWKQIKTLLACSRCVHITTS